MEPLDTVNFMLLVGALLALAGILSSLVAMRFGAPLLLIFLVVGMLAGELGPGGMKFDDVRTTYLVGSAALALILFDGGLRTRFSTFRSVLAPSVLLATVGVIVTAALTAPFAHYALKLDLMESLLVGAVVASTDAAAVFFLLHARGLRLRPRVAATIEAESGTNDPFAIFLTIVLVEMLLTGDRPVLGVITSFTIKAVGGGVLGFAGGRAIVFVLNRLGLPQGMHAVFVTTSAVVVFAMAEAVHASGFLAVYLAGLIVGNRPTRAHNSIITFLDAATWMSQIVMFVLLGLLAWPYRLLEHALPSLAVAAGLMLVARPVAVFLCLAPFRFSRREKLFISWVGLRGAVGVFLASIPLLVNLPNAKLYFDVGFVVVIASLLVHGWTIGYAARWFHIAQWRSDAVPRRVELDLPGQLAQELVGYTLGPSNPYLRRRLMPSWAKLMLVVRKGDVMSAEEAGIIREGDHVYLLAPPERAQALDRFFVDMPPPNEPDPGMLGDFFVPGDTTVGALGEIYGIAVAEEEKDVSVSDFFARRIGGQPRRGDVVEVGPVALVALSIADGRVATAGLRLTEPDPVPVRTPPPRWFRRLMLRMLGRRRRRK